MKPTLIGNSGNTYTLRHALYREHFGLEVYLGQRLSDQRDVAIRMLPAELYQFKDPGESLRHIRELLSQIAPNIPVVRILDEGNVVYPDSSRSKSGFQVLELPQKTMVHAIPPSGGPPLDLQLAISIVRASLDSMIAIQSIHRDLLYPTLEPQMLALAAPISPNSDPLVKINGLGLRELPFKDMTRLGREPAHHAPKNIDPMVGSSLADDVYSFGAISYRLFTGRGPTDSRVPIATLRPDVPPDVVRTISGCLEEEARRRPQSFDEVKDRVRVIWRGQQITPSTARSVRDDKTHILARGSAPKATERDPFDPPTLPQVVSLFGADAKSPLSDRGVFIPSELSGPATVPPQQSSAIKLGSAMPNAKPDRTDVPTRLELKPSPRHPTPDPLRSPPISNGPRPQAIQPKAPEPAPKPPPESLESLEPPVATLEIINPDGSKPQPVAMLERGLSVGRDRGPSIKPDRRADIRLKLDGENAAYISSKHLEMEWKNGVIQVHLKAEGLLDQNEQPLATVDRIPFSDTVKSLPWPEGSEVILGGYRFKWRRQSPVARELLDDEEDPTGTRVFRAKVQAIYAIDLKWAAHTYDEQVLVAGTLREFPLIVTNKIDSKQDVTLRTSWTPEPIPGAAQLEPSTFHLEKQSDLNGRKRDLVVRVRLPTGQLRTDTSYTLAVQAFRTSTGAELSQRLDLSVKVAETGTLSIKKSGTVHIVRPLWYGSTSVIVNNDLSQPVRVELSSADEQYLRWCQFKIKGQKGPMLKLNMAPRSSEKVEVKASFYWLWLGADQEPRPIHISAREDGAVGVAPAAAELEFFMRPLLVFQKWMAKVLTVVFVALLAFGIKIVMSPKIVDFEVTPTTMWRKQSPEITLAWQVLGKKVAVSIVPGLEKGAATGTERIPAPNETTRLKLCATNTFGNSCEERTVEVKDLACTARNQARPAKLRGGPNERYEALFEEVGPGSNFTVLGRDISGKWLHVKRGAVDGWIPISWSDWDCPFYEDFQKLDIPVPVENKGPELDFCTPTPSILEKPGDVTFKWRVLNARNVEFNKTRLSPEDSSRVYVTPDTNKWPLKAFGYVEGPALEVECVVPFKVIEVTPTPPPAPPPAPAPATPPSPAPTEAPAPPAVVISTVPMDVRKWNFPTRLAAGQRHYFVWAEKPGIVTAEVTKLEILGLVAKFWRTLTLKLQNSSLDASQWKQKTWDKSPFSQEISLLEPTRDVLDKTVITLDPTIIPGDTARGTVSIKIPSEGNLRATVERPFEFPLAGFSGTAILILKSPGRITAQVAWTKGPKEMVVKLWAPHKDDFIKGPENGKRTSPVQVIYDVKVEDIDPKTGNPIWYLTIEGEGGKHFEGAIKLEMP